MPNGDTEHIHEHFSAIRAQAHGGALFIILPLHRDTLHPVAQPPRQVKRLHIESESIDGEPVRYGVGRLGCEHLESTLGIRQAAQA